MPPAWKTFDEQTAAALNDRVDEGNVLVERLTQPLFAEGDSVVIAPTLQKGAALVIVARRKTSPRVVEEPAPFAPLLEEIAAPEASPVPPAEPPIEWEAIPEQPVIDSLPADATQASEFTFGPTTWERVDDVESPDAFTQLGQGTRSTDPEIWDIPSQAPPRSDQVAGQPPAVPANSEWEEERYIATGFLGLDDYVQDEEEALRAKRPWWKRIFTD